jgi:hypothetical protein
MDVYIFHVKQIHIDNDPCNGSENRCHRHWERNTLIYNQEIMIYGPDIDDRGDHNGNLVGEKALLL